MTEERKQEIITSLQAIIDGFEGTEEETTLDMFGLTSRYNRTGQNVELIGGDWIIENCPSPLKDLQ